MEVIGAIDEGTQSTRFLLYDTKGAVIASSQLEFTQHTPQAGWVEHDPMEIIAAVRKTMEDCLAKLGTGKGVVLKGIGITNQRETTLCWDRTSGKPIHNAIVWLDSRTADICHRLQQQHGSKDHFRPVTGLPISPYFSAFKMKWMMEHDANVAAAVTNGTAVFGTIDSWLIYNLTGGANGGIFVTDVTNASRTCLMNLEKCEWDAKTAEDLGVPLSALCKIVSCSEVYGTVAEGWPCAGVPIAGCLGDQQAATLGQRCKPGEAKNTYGTGAFCLLNTGAVLKPSRVGLLSTACWKLGPEAPVAYGLEGAIAIAGMGVSWLKDNLGILEKASDVEALAGSVQDTGDVYFVPAFGGLLAPYWDDEARGTIVGMSQYTNKAHIARAMLEAICFQSRDVVEAMKQDSGQDIRALRVDGGASANGLLMQLQADTMNMPVIRPASVETTSLGAAFAAMLALGMLTEADIFDKPPPGDTKFLPHSAADGNARYERWKEAIQRSKGWARAHDS